MSDRTSAKKNVFPENGYLYFYLRQLRDEIQKLIDEDKNLGNKELKVGLWAFKYNPIMEQLETLHFISKSGKKIDEGTKSFLNKVKIQKGYGSIGYSAVAKEV